MSLLWLGPGVTDKASLLDETLAITHGILPDSKSFFLKFKETDLMVSTASCKMEIKWNFGCFITAIKPGAFVPVSLWL